LPEWRRASGAARIADQPGIARRDGLRLSAAGDDVREVSMAAVTAIDPAVTLRRQ
jgi:hypothetical protein